MRSKRKSKAKHKKIDNKGNNKKIIILQVEWSYNYRIIIITDTNRIKLIHHGSKQQKINYSSRWMATTFPSSMAMEIRCNRNSNSIRGGRSWPLVPWPGSQCLDRMGIYTHVAGDQILVITITFFCLALLAAVPASRPGARRCDSE